VARPVLALLLSFVRPAVGPVPCSVALEVIVEVGEIERSVTLSEMIESNTFQERDCGLVNYKYEGEIVLGCWEGELNATPEACFPRRCPTYGAISVAIGEKTVGVMPHETITSGELEVRSCRTVNPTYRGKFLLLCNYGELSVDLSSCVTQWDPMEMPPWKARSRHAAVGLSDGALLLLGGLGLNGPLREVWQWSPKATPELGDWEPLPVPPWTGRSGSTAVQQRTAGGEQVVLIAGNDGHNLRDVWLWTRQPSLSPIVLSTGTTTGTLPVSCGVSASGAHLTCDPGKGGVLGRLWNISGRLRLSTEVHLQLRYNRSGVDGIAVLALQIDDCRLVFEVDNDHWRTRGCAQYVHKLYEWFGGRSYGRPGEWQDAHIELDRAKQEVRLAIDGHALPPVSLVLPAHSSLVREPAREVTAGLVCSERSRLSSGECEPVPFPDSELVLRSFEVAAWPNATMEVQNLSLLALAGDWRQLAEEAPWPARNAHAAAGLPDGDLILMGGLSNDGMLKDVWRWSPKRCTLLPGLGAVVASRYELECGEPCVPSVPHGQWKWIGDAPWAARQGHAVMATASGVLMVGGRTDIGFVSDVWRWTSSGAFCSLAWQGHWEQLTAAAAWPPRYGHSLVGFAPNERGVETVLMVGGFGGDGEPEDVVRIRTGTPIVSRNDIWCGNIGQGNFSVWSQLAPRAPLSERSLAAAVSTPTIAEYSFVLFGGYDANARHRSDFWRWVGENATAACELD